MANVVRYSRMNFHDSQNSAAFGHGQFTKNSDLVAVCRYLMRTRPW